MSLHTLANHLQSAGRGDDKMLVHMTPHEVSGLQSLAMAHGGSLTINPETGLPEAGFLSAISSNGCVCCGNCYAFTDVPYANGGCCNSNRHCN
jgi:hypothetical protein